MNHWASGADFGGALCHVLKLDPETVLGLDIHVEGGAPVRVRVDRRLTLHEGGEVCRLLENYRLDFLDREEVDASE